jgi:Disulphide bond corrector protein DsbC
MRILLVVLLGLSSVQVTPDPVHLSYLVTKTGDKSYELHVTAVMDAGWHIYAQVQPKEAISVPTAIVVSKSPLMVLMGKPKEIGKKELYTDPVAGIHQYYYADKVEFVQSIQLKSAVKLTLSGTITYQACTNEQCLQAKTVSFNVPIE